MCLCKLFDMTLTIYTDMLIAIRTYEIAIILNKTNNRYIHKFSHINSLLNNHRYKALWAAYNYNTIKR